MNEKKNSKIRITKEAWKVLEHFIIEESKQIEHHLIHNKKESIKEKAVFKTYPGKIERDIKVVSRVTVGKACKTFLRMDILEEFEKESGDHLKGVSVVPYALKSDVKTLRKIIKLMLESSFEDVYLNEKLSYPEVIKLLDNYYFTYNINDSLIKEVLAEKEVTITRYFSTLDFDIKSAQRLIDLDNRNYNPSESKTDVAKIMKSIVDRSEEVAKRTEQSRINNLTEFCTGFLEMVNDPAISIESGLQDYENWAVRLIERFDDYRLYYSSPNFGSPLENTRLELPIFCDNIPFEQIKKDNFNAFYYLLYGEVVIELSDILEDAYIANEKIVNQLKKIANFLRPPDRSVSDYSLSDDYSTKTTKLKEKWKKQVKDNEDEYNPILSAKLLEDIKTMYSTLPDKLEKLMVEYDRDYDLGYMIKDIEHTYKIMEKKVLRHFNIKDLKNEFLVNNFDTVLSEHYEKYEYENVIVPILSLIHASPLALNEFLNGKWDPFVISFGRRGESKHNQFLTKLVHIASVNLLLFPKVLKNGIVEYAGMEHVKYPDHAQMLSTYKSNMSLQDYNHIYDSFSKDWYDGMDFAEFKSIEPTFLKIKLKQLYEIRYKLSFLAECNSKSDTIIESRAELKIISELELLKIEHIKDPIGMILKLRSNDGKYAHIRKMFSTQMQNKILFINTDEKPSMSFVKELLVELNNAIMDPEFYDDVLFDDVLPEKEGNKSVLKAHLDQKLSNFEIMRMVNEEPLYHRWFLGLNRYLLEKSFKTEIESGYSWTNKPSYTEHIEKYLEDCAELEKQKLEFKRGQSS